MENRFYQLLDVGLAVEAAPGVFLDTFHQDYGRFEVPMLAQGNRTAVHFEDGRKGDVPFLEVDGVRKNLADNPGPARFAAQILARHLMQRVEAFTILHAAVLGRHGGALALSGPSGAGKTTLTLALLEQGCSYYSDDFCPVHRETRLVHPFPRSLWVRPGPGQKAIDIERGKALFPLGNSGFSIGGPPLPFRWLICLGAEINEGGTGVTTLRVNLRPGLGGPLLEELRGLKGANLAAAEPLNGLRWTLRYRREEGRTQRIKDLLHRHGDAIWNVSLQPMARPDFSQEPVLTTIPTHQAAYFLLQELKHDLGEVRRPSAMKPGAVLSHLVDLLSEVACYRLTPGPLDRCLALIEEALNKVKSR